MRNDQHIRRRLQALRRELARIDAAILEIEPTQDEVLSDWTTLAFAAAQSGLKMNTLRTLIRRGRIASRPISGTANRVLVSRRDVRDYQHGRLMRDRLRLQAIENT